MNNRILFVDDDPTVLEGYQRILHREFSVSIASGPEQALGVISTCGPFAVVVSDMRMPGMNGAQFLAKVREKSPETVRMLLTGYSDLDAAIEAVNEGSIFRYLSKPCEKKDIVKALQSALALYSSAMADKVLVKKARLLSQEAEQWDQPDVDHEQDFTTLAGVSGPSEARAALRPLFGSNSPYYVVLVKLPALSTIEERYGLEPAADYMQGVADFLSKSLRSTDRLFRWTRDVLMLILERRVSAQAVRMEIGRLMQCRRDFVSEVDGRRIMIAAPTAFDLLPVSAFAMPEDILEAFDRSLQGTL